MSVDLEDFEAFHVAVHGRPPFEWQMRLLRDVVAAQAWPRVLDLPTGSGKTTCIDIALFALAMDASAPPDRRWCPRRIVMVVDRRIVVDQAAQRGRTLRNAVIGSSEPILVSVREALSNLVGNDEDPLGVYALRGGIPKDDTWARTPDQPLVIASTVDQIGSRLLLQGYGVTSSMRPIHAGLAANDVLLLLDEVHLSQPFEQTLRRMAKLRTRFESNGLPRRFHFAFLSATPGETETTAFRLNDGEIEPTSALGPRLHAKKPATLAKVSGRDEVSARVVLEAKRFLGRHRVVAAVVNRVDTALRVAATLRAEIEDDVVLLTGRMRPLDRDDVLQTYGRRIATGARTRADDEPKLVVVGTQCIEAGADFDFDALVTESASFDALRQRFGRVDRLGQYRDADGSSSGEGVIVHDKATQDDPIYGDAIGKTVKWLEAQVDKKKRVDFGNRALLDAPRELFAKKPDAPTLLPAYMDLWSQTSPAPVVVPEPSLFLHGPRSGPEDVQVVWRSDIEGDDLSPGRLPQLIAAVGAVPPSTLEAISLPFNAARGWLARRADALDGVGDVEGQAAITAASERTSRRALRWKGEASDIVDDTTLRPGDTIVVPATYGGIDRGNRCFDPSANVPVADLAERAALIGRGLPLLRLHPRVLTGLGLGLDLEDVVVARHELSRAAEELHGWQRVWARLVANSRKVRPVPWESEATEPWVVLEGKRRSARELVSEGLGEDANTSLEEGAQLTTDDENSPFAGACVPLDVHSRDVEVRAREYGERLGFGAAIVDDLALAAWLHDIGKADPRFQRMLRGGSEIAFLRSGGALLAKSEMSPASSAERRRARERSGYPSGARHEVQSIAMIETVREEVAAKAHDMDLVLHLVASHHGHCRPFAPSVDDPNPVEVALERHESASFGAIRFAPTSSANGLHRLDSPLADRFWSLVDRYGWLELCWLEAVLRLADHRASEDEAGEMR